MMMKLLAVALASFLVVGSLALASCQDGPPPAAADAGAAAPAKSGKVGTLYPVTAPAATVGGVTAQTNVQNSFALFAAQAIDGGPSTLDTGYKPPAGHGADIDMHMTCVDRTGGFIRSKNGAGNIINDAGTARVATPIFGGSVGDSQLANCIPSFGVSGSNTLTVTLTPPTDAGGGGGYYGGPLEWLVSIDVTEN